MGDILCVQAEEAGNYDLAQYATILAHGPGLDPPAEVKAEMEKTHGLNHLLEEQLKQLAAQADDE